jgi:hypothetical protein
MEKALESSLYKTADADTSSDHSDDIVFDEKATNRLLRKIDIVLLPLLSLFYLYAAYLLATLTVC